MKSNWDAEDMNTAWRIEGGSNSCFPSGKHLRSKNSRRLFNHMLKNKWRREVNRQMKEELEDDCE